MNKLVATLCVISWSGFWAFGYIALSSGGIADSQLTIAMILAALGMFTGIAAFFGGFLNWHFMMAGSASTNPVMFVLAAFLILIAFFLPRRLSNLIAALLCGDRAGRPSDSKDGAVARTRSGRERRPENKWEGIEKPFRKHPPVEPQSRCPGWRGHECVYA